MTNRLFSALAAVVIAVLLGAATVKAADAPAGDDKGDVDRDRLRKVATLPNVLALSWAYGPADDGRVYAAGDEPRSLDVKTLHAMVESNRSDPDAWMNLASAYRRSGAAKFDAECITRAVALLEKQAADHPEDGAVHARLALARFASGDEARAEESLRAAAKAKQDAWAGAAASADMAVVRMVAKAAGRRFATAEDAAEWLSRHLDAVPRLDGKQLDRAETQFTAAIAGVEASGTTGSAAASVYARHRELLAIQRARLEEGLPAAKAIEARIYEEYRRTLSLLPRDPYAITLLALDAAMTAPADAAGRRFVQPSAKLPDAARAQVEARLTQLRLFAESSNATTSARAFEGIACVQWFVHGDAAAAEATLRKAIEKDPGLRQSWDALTFILIGAERWDGLVAYCETWIRLGDTATKRMRLGAARYLRGSMEDAEKEWRAALALDPNGAETNLGVAALLLRRAEGGAEAKEAREHVALARKALTPLDLDDLEKVRLAASCDLLDAIALGLSGDVPGAEKAARRILEQFGEVPAAREILAALGR